MDECWSYPVVSHFVYIHSEHFVEARTHINEWKTIAMFDVIFYFAAICTSLISILWVKQVRKHRNSLGWRRLGINLFAVLQRARIHFYVLWLKNFVLARSGSHNTHSTIRDSNKTEMGSMYRNKINDFCSVLVNDEALAVVRESMFQVSRINSRENSTRT